MALGNISEIQDMLIIVPSSSGIGRKTLNSTSENEILPVVRKKKSRQIIEEESSDEDENSEVCEVVPMDRRYYVICLRSKKKVEHYIGLSDFSGNQADKYWMQFFAKPRNQVNLRSRMMTVVLFL